MGLMERLANEVEIKAAVSSTGSSTYRVTVGLESLAGISSPSGGLLERMRTATRTLASVTGDKNKTAISESADNLETWAGATYSGSPLERMIQSVFNKVI
jgi:hypothetical protein